MPAWLAVIEAIPAPTMVTVLPETVATAVLLLEYVGASPEDEVADKVKGASPKTLLDKAAKVMVWDALFTVKD